VIEQGEEIRSRCCNRTRADVMGREDSGKEGVARIDWLKLFGE